MDFADEFVGRSERLRLGHQLSLIHVVDLFDLAENRACVRNSLDDVAGPGLALGADHRRALANSA